MPGIVSSNRQALELQRRKSLVEIVEERRDCGEHLLARCKVRAAEAAEVVVHWDEMSAKAPLDRIRPPSVPKIAEFVPGISTIA